MPRLDTNRPKTCVVEIRESFCKGLFNVCITESYGGRHTSWRTILQEEKKLICNVIYNAYLKIGYHSIEEKDYNASRV